MSNLNGPARLSRRALLAAGAVGAAALGSPLLAGCTSSDKTGSGNTAGASKPTAAPLQLGAEVTGPVYKADYVGPRARVLKPFSDGSKTFTVVVPQDSAVVGDWSKNKTTAWFEKQTGVKINFQPVLITDPNGGTDMTKINAMLSGGQLPDAFMGIPFTQAQLSVYGQQGIFQGLDSLIGVYAPRTREAMKDYPDLQSLAASSNGKLYQMPGVNDCYHCRSSNGRAWISQKYLDKIGAKMPTTTDELRQVLLEFKQKNPSGQSGFIPLAAGVGNALDNFFMQPFLYSPLGSQTGGWMRLNNGKVEFTPNLPEWREALKYLRRLGDDGIINAQTFSMTATELQTAGNKGLLGFVRAYWWGSFFNPVALDKNAPWRDYVAVPPLKGPNGTRTAQWDYYGYITNGLQITNACKDPELLVQWSDTQMDLEASEWMVNGVKDSNWSWAAKGAKGLDGQQAVWQRVANPAPLGQSWSQYATMYRSADWRSGLEVDPKHPTFEAGLQAAGETYAKYAEPQQMQLPPLIIPDASAAQVADTATSIQQQVTQAMSQFALGQKNINSDADWNAYTDTFTKMNLKGYLDIYQKAYDSRPH